MKPHTKDYTLLITQEGLKNVLYVPMEKIVMTFPPPLLFSKQLSTPSIVNSLHHGPLSHHTTSLFRNNVCISASNKSVFCDTTHHNPLLIYSFKILPGNS